MIEEGIDNKQKTWCVYMHTNIINNKKYIGITKKSPKKRWGCKGYGYKKSQPVFWNAIQKYGWDNFKHEILFNNLSQKEAQEKEIELIAKYKTNCCSGKYKHSGGFKWLYEKDYEQLKRWNYGKEKDEEV